LIPSKRLAEVDFPIAVVSKHAAREKSIRHGHPSTLHLWWARRPLASCRAVLLALLLPDPCDHHCLPDFKSKAREILRPLPGRVGSTDEDLRDALFRFIGDFADWDHASNPTFLEVGQALVKAAFPEETPLVVDPFAGGGSIPLGALRVGSESYASDLNPVACLILRTILADVPVYPTNLVDAVRTAGAAIKNAADRMVEAFFPHEQLGAKPIAYLWARTARCEAPNCGAEIPLLRSMWLSKRGEPRALRYKIRTGEKQPPEIEFEIFSPRTVADVPRGLVKNGRAICACCGTVLSAPRLKAQLSSQHGGADVIFSPSGERVGGARLIAVVIFGGQVRARQFRPRRCRKPNAVSPLQPARSWRISYGRKRHAWIAAQSTCRRAVGKSLGQT
jgi:adenine-specific DNA methylase